MTVGRFIAKACGVVVFAVGLFILVSDTPEFSLAAFAAAKVAGGVLLIAGGKIIEAADPSIAEEEV